MKERSRRGSRSIAGVAALALVMHGMAWQAAAQPAAAPQPSPTPAKLPSEAAPADGAAPASEEEAIRRFGEGRHMLEAGDYAGALVELRASLASLPSPNTELLVGHAQRLGGARGEAAATYRRVIASAGEKVRAGEDRFQATLEEAGRWEATLRTELAEVEIFVAGAPSGTSVAVDGAEVEASPHPRGVTVRLLHEPGPIAVTARSPEGRTASGSANGTAGARVAIELDLAAKAEPPPAGRGIDPPPLPSWIAAGVGATGLVVFGVFGAMSAGAASDLDACAPSCSPSLRETADGGARDQTIANVGLVVGAVGFVTAGVLWITWPGDEPSSAPASNVSPPVATPAALRLRVSPVGAADVSLRF